VRTLNHQVEQVGAHVIETASCEHLLSLTGCTEKARDFFGNSCPLALDSLTTSRKLINGCSSSILRELPSDVFLLVSQPQLYDRE
jgi:hypothetical protein